MCPLVLFSSGIPIDFLRPPSSERQPYALQCLAAVIGLVLGVSVSVGGLSAQVAGDTLAGERPAAADLVPDDFGGDGWNTPVVLDLVERGRAARGRLVRDGSLESYQALTEGHIYFFVDPEEGERSLIRVDQVAVELFWEAPDRIRQRLVGERSETRLPVRDFRYYLDRLTLVQYGFGDEIQVGQGMDVAGVPHPLAPLAGDDPGPGPYDFRLADSISLHLPGEPAPLTIYEVQVRPRDPSAPGVLGSIFLDRMGANLVRMSITFTPASYVDRRTDRIAVELDYGLWEGEYWLPNMQRMEVRRELPEFDLGVGTVIRAVLRVGDYDLNVPIPSEVRTAPPISTLPEHELATWDFPEGLFDALERDGLTEIATRADPRELRIEAARMLRDRPPTGLSPIRLHLPDLSSLVSYDRARGVDAGAGLSIRPHGALRLRLAGGWSFGPRRARASLELDGVAVGDVAVRLSGFANARADLGVTPGVAPLFGSLGAALLGEDYLDPYRRSGASIRASRVLPGQSELRVEAGLERHRSEELLRSFAPWNSDRAFRPVLPVHDGTFGQVAIGWMRPFEGMPGGGRGQTDVTASLLAGEGEAGVRLGWSAESRWRTPSGDRDAAWKARLGTAVGDPLPQLHRMAGGRGTVPGHPYRSRTGRSLALTSLEGAADLGSPMVRLRAGVHGGWLDGERPPQWEGAPSPPGTRSGALGGLTLGLGVLYDLIRIEGARGVGPDGEWQLLLSLDSRWWDLL